MSYHDHLKAGIEQNFEESPSSLSLYTSLARRMNAGGFDKRLVDAVAQKSRGRYDVYDAWVYGQVHAMVKGGEMVMFTIEFGETPCADKEVEKNNRKLAQLPLPFHAKFLGGNRDFDGHLSWDKPLMLSHNVSFDGSRTIEAAENVPLEVGYTQSTTTWVHLCQQQTLARWPYGHTAIYVIQWRAGDWNARREGALPSLVDK